MDYNTGRGKNVKAGTKTALKAVTPEFKGVASMDFYNISKSPFSQYDKTTHQFSEFHCLNKEMFESEAWEDAIRDPQGCTIYLPYLFVYAYEQFGRFWVQLVETSRLSQIDFIKNLDVTDEVFGTMSDEDKESHCIICVRIVLADKPQSHIQMRMGDKEAFHPVPYADVTKNNVITPDRYPILEQNIDSDQELEPLSDHVSIVPYTGNAPDIMILRGEYLLRFDSLPAVLEKDERPKYALKIDLNYCFPECLQWLLYKKYAKEIIYGTIPGPAGEEEVLRRIVALNVPHPSPLQKEMKNILRLKINLSSQIDEDIAWAEVHAVSLTPSSLQDDFENNVSGTLGGVLGTAAGGVLGAVSGGVIGGGITATSLVASTLMGAIFPIGLGVAGILGASRLLKKHQEIEESQDRLEREKALIKERNRIIEEQQKQLNMIQERKQEELERQRREIEKLQSWMNDTNSICYSLRSTIDFYAIKLMRDCRNISLEDLLEFSKHLRIAALKDREISKKLVKSPYAQKEHGPQWIHMLSFDDIDNLIRIIKTIEKIKDILSRESQLDPFDKACPECGELLNSNFDAGIGFFPNISHALLGILESCSREYAKRELEEANRKREEAEKESEEAKIRADERQAVLYEMSHHIKNRIVSVIDPLENMLDTLPENNKYVLADAINSANMIRQIVFSITNSYRSTVEDFLYDLSHHEETPQTIESLFESTLRSSVISMFHKQTHGKYMKGFYPSRDIFILAKRDWYATKNLPDTIRFMNQDMNIKTDITLDPFRDIGIGDDKGSATNVSILFNELIMNMLKALAFVPEKDRLFSVSLEKDNDMIRFLFANTSINSVGMSRGYGNTIVKNIVKGLGGTLSYQPGDKKYTAVINLPFFQKITIKES